MIVLNARMLASRRMNQIWRRRKLGYFVISLETRWEKKTLKSQDGWCFKQYSDQTTTE